MPAFPEVGQFYEFQHLITDEDVAAFCALTKDDNPLHMDADYARKSPFKKRVVHGMLVAGIASRLVGVHIPGTGSLWFQQDIRFLAPTFIGDLLTFRIEVLQVSQATDTVRTYITVKKADGKSVLEGEGKVMIVNSDELSSNERECKVAFVSGASRGIGAAIAQALARQDIAVAVNYASSASAAEDVVAAIENRGGTAFAVKADVRDPQQVQAAIAATTEHFGQSPDLLVVNAGGAINAKKFSDVAWEDFSEHLDMQVKGAFNCVSAVLPGMVENKFGKIVFINSTSAWGVPPATWTTYVAAKAAMHGIAKSLAVEYGPQGIMTNSVFPGMTDTDLVSDIPDRMKKVMGSQVPLRRLATAQDTANVVAFLASKYCGYMNGADLPVAGGMVMR